MIDEVQSVIEKWQSDKRLTSLDEAKVQQVIILPILRELGWNPDNDREVEPQYRVEDRKVDYALLIGSAVKVFIEAKNGGESLEKPTHQEQLLRYSFKRGVRIAVLTNGTTWWFYLPIREVSWERRRVATVELNQQDIKEINRTLNNLLSRENVKSGTASQNAESHQILEALPDVWNRLVSEPNGPILNLLAERTQRLCIRKPDVNEVEQFLSSHSQQLKIALPTSVTELVPTPEPTIVPAPAPQPNPSGRWERARLQAFTFCGNRYKVSSWRDMIVKLCEIVHSEHSDQFDEVLTLRGGKGRPYFSRHPDEVREPKEISGTDIYVTATGAKTIKQIARRLITHFGYDENDLSYETRKL